MSSSKLFKSVLCVAFLVLLILAVTACSQKTETPAPEDPTAAALPTIKVGTLQTDDLLPLWVAQAEGFLTDVGLDVEIITFQAPQEQLAAVTAGEIDAIMTDMAVPALLAASGTSIRAATVMQGMPAGIVTTPDSGLNSLKDLAGVPVALSTATIIEYLVDTALPAAGIPAEQVKAEEIDKLPVRLEMLMAGQVKAAGLPWTLVAMAQQQGANVLFDREAAKDYPATVLCFTQKFLDGTPAVGNATTPEAAAEAIKTLLPAWDRAVEKINAGPDTYRSLLVEKANLPEPLRETYPIPTYPKTHLPEQAQWDAVLAWMDAKGYLQTPITYNDLIIQP